MFTFITYRGRIAAIATPRRFYLTGELLERPAGDPDATFVAFMCNYAADVHHGVLPGPYDTARAELYARSCVLDRFAFAEHADESDVQLARRFCAPVDQIAKRRDDLAVSRLLTN